MSHYGLPQETVVKSTYSHIKMATSDIKKSLKSVIKHLLSNLNQRNQDVINRRFGLESGEPETLQAIGDDYRITRERVRQIEEVSMRQLREYIKNNYASKIDPFIVLARSFLDQSCGVLKQEDLFEKFSGSSKDNSLNYGLLFLMELDGSFVKHMEDNSTYSFWASSDTSANDFTAASNRFIKMLSQIKKPVLEADLATLCAENNVYFKESVEKTISSIFSISKEIGKNNFGEVGLIDWPEIKPRGVRDKSYIVLKRVGEPKHFREITKLINETKFSNSSGSKVKANTQTVHNELIKDNRFVLVGRGVYALSHWGFEPGTIKDVMISYLKKNGPSNKNDLIAHVLNTRMVKRNTILLGLKDKKFFDSGKDGVIKLKKA